MMHGQKKHQVMLWTVVIIIEELLNVIKAHIKNTDELLKTLQFVLKIPADIIKFICSSM